MSSVFKWQEAPEAEFAVIGDPVSHSLSPRMHAAAFAAHGLPFRYLAIHVPVGEVRPALDRLCALGYRGVNVTVPHKEAAMEWCSGVEPFARHVRAVNTIRMSDRAGMNTDAPGFLDTLRDLGLKGGTALLLGAGGSARALTLALAEEGWRLRIYNRTPIRAEEMVESLGVEADLLASPDPAGVDLILNTTSASLQAADLALDWVRAPKHAVAYDLMYAKEPTRFLAAAASHGLRICDGLPLLVAQGARAFEWWIGIPGPRDEMRRAIA